MADFPSKTSFLEDHNTINLSRHEQVYLSGLDFAMIMSHIFKGNMRTFTETMKLTDKKKSRNVTN